MCEINPKHKRFFRLEVYTSNPNISQQDFEAQIMQKLLDTEMKLNEDGRFRFHIHDEIEVK